MSREAERWDHDLDERATPAPLLQTWAWGEVQARAGWTVERMQSSTTGAMASVLVRKVGPAREAYVPRGPVPATPEAIDSVVDWARKSKMARLVIEPEAPEDFGEVLTEKHFKRVAPTQPQHTRILKLLPPDQLLPTFRHGRRYNIRTGIKRGVVVVWDEPGGWYDHVPPPQTVPAGYGMRVPMMVISPYAKQGYISHTFMDHVSILKFIQWNWGLDPLNQRNQSAGDMREMFTF